MNDLNTPLLDAALIELKTELHRADIKLATARPESLDSSNRMKQFRERIRATIQDLECDDTDGAPWCQYCGAKRERDCNCGPIAENN